MKHGAFLAAAIATDGEEDFDFVVVDDESPAMEF